jgi:predicted small secreted protein
MEHSGSTHVETGKRFPDKQGGFDMRRVLLTVAVIVLVVLLSAAVAGCKKNSGGSGGGGYMGQHSRVTSSA